MHMDSGLECHHCRALLGAERCGSQAPLLLLKQSRKAQLYPPSWKWSQKLPPAASLKLGRFSWER